MILRREAHAPGLGKENPSGAFMMKEEGVLVARSQMAWHGAASGSFRAASRSDTKFGQQWTAQRPEKDPELFLPD